MHTVVRQQMGELSLDRTPNGIPHRQFESPFDKDLKVVQAASLHSDDGIFLFSRIVSSRRLP
jgi:hypothetical protein